MAGIHASALTSEHKINQSQSAENSLSDNLFAKQEIVRQNFRDLRQEIDLREEAMLAQVLLSISLLAAAELWL